jgi:hypothetical protein
MADENPTGKSAAEPPAPDTQDLRDQALVLTQVLANWPTPLGIADLIRELAESPAEFPQRDRIERAVRDLVGAGLAHRCGVVVLPTHAALRFERLAALL